MEDRIPHSMLKELESIIQTLTSELQAYKSECETSKSKIIALVNENRDLSFKLKDVSEKHQQEMTIKRKYEEGDLVLNLKSQIECLTREKESVVQLWQTAVNTIDALEDELKLYRGRSHEFVPKAELEKAKNSHAVELKALQDQLSAHQTRLNEASQKYSHKLESKIVALDLLSQEKADALRVVEKLETEIQQLRTKLNTLEKTDCNLEHVVTEKEKEIADLKTRLAVSRNKITEAIEVAESALAEKDDALMREAQIKEEMSAMSKSITTVVKEALQKAEKELNAVRSEYQEKMVEVNEKLKSVQEQLKTKTTEYEKCRVKCESLEKEVNLSKRGCEQFNESSTSKLLVLEKNLESTFQKLVGFGGISRKIGRFVGSFQLLSEKKNLQMTAERESIKRDLEQMASHFERDIKQRELEKRSLEHRVDSLQKELDQTNNKFVEVSSNLQKVQSKLRLKELDIQKQRNMKASFGDYRFFEKSAQKFNEVEAVSVRVYQELYAHLQQQILLSKKWKAEAYRIQNRFEERLKELKRENVSLAEKLAEAESKMFRYMDSFQTICTGVNKIADATSML